MKQNPKKTLRETPSDFRVAEYYEIQPREERDGVVGRHIYPQPYGRVTSPAAIVARIREGLPLSELDTLRRELDLPVEQLSEKLGISRATLHRRKATGRLIPDESDKVVRFARLLGLAVEAFGSIEDARQWLKFPQYGLGGETPLDYAQTEVGAREVENLLGRIEYSVVA